MKPCCYKFVKGKASYSLLLRLHCHVKTQLEANQAIFKDFGGGRREEALIPTLFHVYESESGRPVKRESSTATSPNTTIKQAALSTGTLLRGLPTVPTTLNELH